MEVIVEDKQLSLAIGKKGQNVRLAAKLTGWRIDIKSEEEKRREVEAQLAGFVPETTIEETTTEEAATEEAATEEPTAGAASEATDAETGASEEKA
jgi:N utilization substance protein A